MLVLTRRVGESIVVAGDIVIRVTAVQGNRVKLGIVAPQHRRVLRGEIAASLDSLEMEVSLDDTDAATAECSDSWSN